MGERIECAQHGEQRAAFICSHLASGAADLGFNSAEASDENPFPDAWCDECERIRAAHGGWNEQSEQLLKVLVICSRCYELVRIRNTRTPVTLEDLATLRWKCHTCEDWHTGPCLDFGYDAPDYWGDEYEDSSRNAMLASDWSRTRHKSFLNEDYCAIDDQNFFVRGIILLPIIGTAQNFCWGVWGSLSRANFEVLLSNDADPGRVKIAPMFSWLSSQIPEYPDTLNLKMYAHVREGSERPHFELERTDHPLSFEFYGGISPERVKQIMKGRLRNSET
jgi:hypothetical protein